MSKYFYADGSFILGKYEVKKQVRSDAFGEYYQTENIDNNKCKTDILLFSIEQNSAFRDAFEEFFYSIEKKVLNNDGVLRELNILSVEKFEINHSKRLFIVFSFPENSFLYKLSEEILWNEETFSVQNILSEEKVLGIMSDLAKSLSILHNENVIHSFISPDTVSEMNKGYALAVPFFSSLLKSIGDRNICSILYNHPEIQIFPLAPEVILEQNNLAPSSDVWSLGILLSILSYGQLPFHFSSNADYVSAVKNNELLLKESDIPEYARYAVTGALKLDPGQRISLDEFVSLLNNKSAEIAEPSNDIYAPKIYKDWIEFPRELSAFSLSHSNESFPIKVSLYPSRNRILKNYLEKGEKANFIFKCNSIGGQRSIKKLGICVLPAPMIEINSEKSSLNKISNSDIDCEFEGMFYFRMIRSTIRITRILITLYDREDEILHELEAEFDQYGNKISTSANTEWYHFSTRFFSKCIIVGQPLKIGIKCKLDGHSDLDSSCILTPRFPAKLNCKFDLENRLRTNMGGYKTFELPFNNIGGNKIRIRSFRIEPDHRIMNVVTCMIPEKWLSTDEEFHVKLNVDASQICQAQTLQGKLIVDYSENCEYVIKSRSANFSFHLQINSIVREKGSVLAIDFGTTNTCAAFYRNGSLKTITWPASIAEVFEDPKSTPSFIYYSDREDMSASPVRIGKDAKEAFWAMKRNTFHSIKRFICSENIESVFFKGAYQKITYEQMTYDFLKELINVLKEQIGIKFDRYIFTHPTDFGNERKRKFEEIVSRLDLSEGNNRIEYVDEATAGALDKLRRLEDGKHYFLIFDFGGGTTDIVFAEFNLEFGMADLLGTNKRFIRPIFTCGNDFGGDDINLQIISILRELYAKKNGVIPYIPPDQLNKIPGTFRPDVEMSYIQSNAQQLWNFAERFKKNINNDDFVSDEKFAILQNADLYDYNTWNFTNIKEAEPLKNIDKEFINELRKKTFAECGKKINEIITCILNFIHCSEYRSFPFNILLLGRSSRFPIVKDLFEYYLKDGASNLEKEYKWTPKNSPTYCFDPGCSIELPEELKHVVATGALEWNNDLEIEFKNNVLLYAITNSNGNTLIQPGKEKVSDTNIRGLLTSIKESEYGHLAVYCTEKWTQWKTIPKTPLFKKDVRKKEKRGTLDGMIPDELKNTNNRLCLYVNDEEKIKWFLFDENFNASYIGDVN